MPIYAYRCEHCGHAKDVLQKISDPVLTECPACGEPTFRKQVTAAGFQLKGSGWYVTDFKGDKPGGKAVDADAKPDAKPDAKDGDAKRADANNGNAAATESQKVNGSADAGKSGKSEPSVSPPSTAAPAPAAAPTAGSGGPAPGRQP